MKTLFKLTEEDAQSIAQNKFGCKLTDEELERVEKGLEFGLECWEEVMIAAIEEAIEERGEE